MYTLPKDTPITNQILNDVIAYNERYKERFEMLERYYLGKHGIFDRSKDDRLSNNKVMVNHAKYITDTNVGYLLFKKFGSDTRICSNCHRNFINICTGTFTKCGKCIDRRNTLC